MTIGQRAAQAIRETAAREGIKLFQELYLLGFSKEAFYGWEKNGHEPQAYFLRQLALAGYDVYWILTGERTEMEDKT